MQEPATSLPEILLSRIFENINVNIVVTDLDTNEILFMNNKMMKEFGITESRIGQKCWNVLHAAQEKRCTFCPLELLKINPEEVIVWEELNTSNGKLYKNTSRVIEWLDGKPVHMQGSVDMTEEKTIQKSLIEAKQLSDSASRMKSDFLSRMNHEIRTPLNAIIGMSKIALNAPNIDKIKECLVNIDASSDHLLKLVNDIFDVSKIGANEIELKREPFDFERMLVRIHNIISDSTQKKHQSFNIHMDSNVPRLCLGDELRLSQIILNLLSNAVKFTPEYGAISLDVREKSREGNKSVVEVKASDTGIGIDKKDIAQLFTGFEQADGGSSRKYGGTGIGLSISKSLANMMNGDIFVESELNKGSVFTFCAELALDESMEQIPPAIFSDSKERTGEMQENTVNNIQSHGGDIPDIPGLAEYINVPDALARVRGNRKIYKTLLQSFVKNSRIDILEEEVRAGNLTDAAKTAHNVKGSSANLSLVAVCRDVTQLESQLKAGYFTEEALESCLSDFAKTIKLIDELINKM